LAIPTAKTFAGDRENVFLLPTSLNIQ
jgi:hypothetical protein